MPVFQKFGAVAPVRYPLAVGDALRACFSRPTNVSDRVYAASGQRAIELALQGVLETEAELAQPAVIIPDFICPAVPRAVQAVGLKPKYVRLDPRTWFYDLDDLAGACSEGNCVVIIIAYFGFLPDLSPSQITAVRKMLQDVPVIEDWAQAFGLAEAHVWSNAGGFRTFSFGPGKSLPINGGGLVIGMTDTARHWLRSVDMNSPRYAWFGNLTNLLLAQLQSLLTHHTLWWLVPFPHHLRRAADGAARTSMAWPRTSYVSVSHCRLMKEIDIRRRNARMMAVAIGRVSGVVLPGMAAIDTGAALRLPIMFTDQALAAAVKRDLESVKLIKGPNDWWEYNRGTSNATDIADRLLTLPTYAGSEGVQQASVDIIRTCCRRIGPASKAADITASACHESRKGRPI